MQRHTDAPHDTAHNLAVSRFCIQDAPGGDRVDDAGDADDAELLVDLNLGKNR